MKKKKSQWPDGIHARGRARSKGNMKSGKVDLIKNLMSLMLSLFSASLDRTEDWRTEAASTPSKTLQRPGPGRWLRSTICARWTRFSHVIWFLPVWCCKNLIWLRSRPQVVGDGNFAVVRVCYSRLTRKEFAVKIIDKVRAYSHHHSTFFFL